MQEMMEEPNPHPLPRPYISLKGEGVTAIPCTPQNNESPESALVLIVRPHHISVAGEEEML